MKKLLSIFAALMLVLGAQAQLVGVVNEVVYTDDGSIAAYPSGSSTYRIYAELADGTDAVTAVYAESGSSLLLGTEDDNIWNTAFGGIIGTDLNAAFFVPFPEVEWDSMVTIGRASTADAGSSITAVSVLPSNTVIADSFGGAVAGPDLVMNDGTWFSTPDGANTNGQGANFRVLLAQITTSMDIEYNLNIQVLDGGIGGTQFKYVWDPASIDTPEEADGSALGLSYAPTAAVAGCMDNTACNYNTAATSDDGSCVFATGCDTCSGETDGTGTVVDNPEVGEACDDGLASTINDTVQADCSCVGVGAVPGCTDNTACNYNVNANTDDGSCVFATGCDTCSGETDGSGTVVDNPEVGEACDDGDAGTTNDTVQADCSCAGDVLGCTDATATNYDATAVVEDGSCLYLCASDPADLLTVSNFTSFDDGSGNSYGSPSGMGLVAGGNNIFGGHLWNVATSGFTTSDICINIDYTVTGDAADFPKTLEFRIENNGTGNGNSFNLEVPGPGTYNLGGIVSSGATVGAGFDPEGATPAIVAAIAHFEATPLNGNLDIVFSNLCASTDCGVSGCTDVTANNYDAAATTDDGSCLYDVTLTVDMNCFDGTDPNIEDGGDGTFTTPAVEGPSFGWCGSCVPMMDNGDGTWSVTLELPAGDFEYKYAHDGFAGQEQLVDDMVGGASCAPVTDFANFANRLINIPTVLSTNDVYGSCGACAPGCTDMTACNYDAAATFDNGSCVFATGCDTCSGETDGTGVVVDNPEVGEACDDGDAATIGDTIQADCSCAGVNPSLPQSQLDYPAGDYDLCDLIKADWVGADDYRFVFIPQPSGTVINVEQGGSNTFLLLTSVMGLEVGTTYGVTVDALFGATWSIGTVSTDVTISSPNPNVNPNDVCGVHGPHALGDYISAKPYVCGGDKWEWTFTADGQLPIVKTRNSSNRFLRLSSVGGLLPGTSYDVTVRAGYPNGAFTPMSDVVCISIVGVAPGGIAAGGPSVDADADLERTEEGAAAVAFYPNPNTGDFLNVNLMGVESPKVTLDIVNMMGASVKRVELNVAGGNVNEVISLDGLASGVYLVNTTMNGEVFTERLIIQK